MAPGPDRSSTPSMRSFMSGYIRRVVDEELDALLPQLPAVLLDGPLDGIPDRRHVLPLIDQHWGLGVYDHVGVGVGHRLVGGGVEAPHMARALLRG